MAFRDFLTNLHIGSASGWDLFIILIFLVTVLVYGFFLGRNRMIILLLGSYFSLAIVQAVPWQRITSYGWLGIGQEPSSSLRTLIFLCLILLFYFLIPRSVLSSTLRIRKRGYASWLQLFTLSVVQVGLLAMVILSFLPQEAIDTLSSPIRKILTGSEAQFVWILLPILTMVLIRRKRKLDKDK